MRVGCIISCMKLQASLPTQWMKSGESYAVCNSIPDRVKRKRDGNLQKVPQSEVACTSGRKYVKWERGDVDGMGAHAAAT
jgi:hypothetical protein